MAVRSQNGYTANDRSVITTYVVTKTGRKMALRVGSPGKLLARFIRWFDENIRDIDPGILDEWGYAERLVRGGTDVSNHASGTAGDVDATKWPLGVEATRYLTAAEIAKVHAELRKYKGCIRWGADYTGRKDPMHFEIDRDEATCDRVLAELEEDDVDPLDVWKVPLPERSDKGPGPAMDWLRDTRIGVGKLLEQNEQILAQQNAILARESKIEERLTALEGK